jgi:hypothetical protein
MEHRQTTRPDDPLDPPREPRERFARPDGPGDPYSGAGDRYSAAGDSPPRAGRFDLAALFAIVDAVRRAMPAELQAQFTALLREVLLTLRSLIDWYLERLDRGPREPRVEDIPID